MVEIRRVAPMQPGEYSIRRGGRVALACPCCGVVVPVDWPYKISETGVVLPAWLCLQCNWSGVIKLTDYAEEVVG